MYLIVRLADYTVRTSSAFSRCFHFFEKLFRKNICKLLKALHAVLCPVFLLSLFILFCKLAKVGFLDPDFRI
jgi:hypothetical protein